METKNNTNAAVLLLPGEEDPKKLLHRGGVEVEWTLANGATQKVSRFSEKKPRQIREDELLLPTMYLHQLDERFMVKEGEFNIQMRSGNDNSEIMMVLPDDVVMKRRGLDAKLQESFDTVIRFLQSQGEVMANESTMESGKCCAKLNRHRLNFKMNASRPKAAINLPKDKFGIPEEASIYLFVENHPGIHFMTPEDRQAFEDVVEEFASSGDPELRQLAVFIKIFHEGGFGYNKKKPISGGYIPINASICCLGLTPAFDGQAGIATGYPYQLMSTHLPFIETVPVSISAIADMSNRHKRYGLCFTRCIHVWEGEDFSTSGALSFCAVLPHGGFYYVCQTLTEHWKDGGLVYAFGESKETPAQDVNATGEQEVAAAAAPQGPDEIQVCFTMDCTGSMGNWIEQSKKDVINMADSISAEAQGLKVEFSFVCYRDYDSGRDNILSRDFTTNIGSIKEFIGTLKAQGGDDAPEDMAGGLAEALRLKWSPRAKKFLVVVADAPCHGGKRFHNLSDRHEDGGVNGLPDKHLEKLRNDGIQLVFVKINVTTDKMITEFKRIYETASLKLNVADLSAGGTKAFQAAITSEVVANLG